MFKCFKCSRKQCIDINTFIKHLRNDHFLTDNNDLHCGIEQCWRTFNYFNSFRQQSHIHDQNQILQKIEVNKTSVESYVEYSDYDEEIVQESYSEDASNNIFLVTKIFNSELFNFVNEMYNNSVVPRKCVQFYHPKIIFFCKGLTSALKKN
jgi:hypothetical protein